MTSTRDKIIASAITHFSERGFYGTSLDSVAKSLSITKQALLHHFGSKERLYGEVIAELTTQLEAEVRRATSSDIPNSEQLSAALINISRYTEGHIESTQLLMRELMDNREREPAPGRWYLKPFLEQLTALYLLKQGWTEDQYPKAMARIYAMLGVINYFAVSAPTLKRMFGDETFNKLYESHQVELLRLLEEL